MPGKVLLTDLPVFQGVSKDRLQRLGASLKERTCRPGEIVYRTGEPCDGLYVVEGGGVMLRSETPGKPLERVLDVLAGEVFGELEVVEGSKRRHTARALGQTSILSIPLKDLRELLREQPLVETFLRTLSVRRQSSRARALLARQSRREPRIWVDRDVVVKTGRGESHRVRLLNLSTGGACIASAPVSWKVDQPLIFTLAGNGGDLLAARTIIRWRQDAAVGISFEGIGPQHRRRVEQALRQLVPGSAVSA
jgi:CRP-like cAMP-binding protein